MNNEQQQVISQGTGGTAPNKSIMHKRFMPDIPLSYIMYQGCTKKVVRGRGETQAGGGEYGEKKFFRLNRWKGGAWYSAYTPLYSNHSYNILVENKELQTFLFFQGASTSYNLGHYPQYYPPHNPSAGWQSGWQSPATTWATFPNTIPRTILLQVGSQVGNNQLQSGTLSRFPNTILRTVRLQVQSLATTWEKTER